jgi:hypothetical protein
MKIKGAAYLAVFLLLALLLGCSDDKGASNPLDPDVNNPPEIQEQADTFVTVGETLILQAVASDADGDSLGFSAVAYVTWSEIQAGEIPNIDMDVQTGLFRFVPADYDTPDRSITFIVNDYNGGLDSTSFIVTVNE